MDQDSTTTVKDPCLLPLINRAVGLPDGVAMEAVLHRIGKIQEAWRQFEAWMSKQN